MLLHSHFGRRIYSFDATGMKLHKERKMNRKKQQHIFDDALGFDFLVYHIQCLTIIMIITYIIVMNISRQSTHIHTSHGKNERRARRWNACTLAHTERHNNGTCMQCSRPYMPSLMLVYVYVYRLWTSETMDWLQIIVCSKFSACTHAKCVLYAFSIVHKLTR